MVRAAEDVRRIRPERVPPNNLEAEESVLGSMMLSSDAIADVVEIVQPADFYRSANGKIFGTLREVYGRGDPVDAITAVEELKRRDLLSGVGGHLYIHELVERVPTPAAAASYARIVAETALLRRLIGAAADIMEMAYSAPEEPERVADEAEHRIYEVARHDEREQVASLRELVDQAMTDLETFTVTRDGKPFKSVDFNFWGVTFRQEPGLFYATLASGGHTYLIEGDAVARTARVIRDAVECPSLSPDNRRLAFKHLERGVAASW